ncbi:MAG: uracil-DNA glycosylase family protein [Candidatus Thiodiazotropha sp.]
MSKQAAIQSHQNELKACTTCPQMLGPVVTGNPVVSPIILVGQAPGDKEGPAGRPFAWTAGKTLFSWFEAIGLNETTFRERVYMAAVCRCFPGKKPKGGDRVPDREEIAQCRHWLDREISLLQPHLIIPVGKLAIRQFLQSERLVEVVGNTHRIGLDQRAVDIIPLPHPSGASTWHRTEPGKTLLGSALQQIADHPAWKSIMNP